MARRVHVGFSLLTLFPRRVGGTETYVRGLLGEYARGNGPERLTVLANRHVAAEYGGAVGGPVALHHVRSYRPGDSDATRALAMASARVLPRLVARDVPEGLDIVHLPVTVPIPRTDRPTVVTIHEVQYHELPEFFSRAERRYRRWAYDGAARSADVVVAISEYVAGKLVERAGVDPERIEVVHYGVDHETFVPTRGERDEALLAGLRLPERFAVYPANLWPHKNHARLLEAFARVQDAELALVLAGQAYGRLDPLLEQARRLGVEQRVHHVGHLERATLAALYRRAEAMLFPSLHEGFGAPPLEAMACGCPVASATNTSLAEVCGDAVLALDASQTDSIAAAIERITSDESLRERLRRHGLERARGFTWKAAAERHTAIYERAAAT